MAIIATAACKQSRDTNDAAWIDPSPHRTEELRVNGIRLQYLAWGDHGDPVLFVHGSGDSPHYFDDIAPALAANHRIYAPARRGHGQSEVPSAPFSLDDLTDDLIGLLDTLHLEKVTLIGFSFSGNEITRFAERYPARVSRLVYIDAAFEHSRPEQATVFENLPILPQPASSDVGSLNAFRSFAQKVWYPGDAWTNTMEAVLRDFVTVGPNGSVTIPSDRVTPSMQAIQSRYRRDYSLITCPVLAIMPECYEHVPVGVADKTRAAMAHWPANQFGPYQRAMVEALTRGIRSVRIVRLKGLGHNGLPVSARAQIISELETFLTPAVPAQQSTGRPLAQLSR